MEKCSKPPTRYGCSLEGLPFRMASMWMMWIQVVELCRTSMDHHQSMGDFQDPKKWRYVNVLFFMPKKLWGQSLKHRPFMAFFMWNRYLQFSSLRGDFFHWFTGHGALWKPLVWPNMAWPGDDRWSIGIFSENGWKPMENRNTGLFCFKGRTGELATQGIRFMGIPYPQKL